MYVEMKLSKEINVCVYTILLPHQVNNAAITKFGDANEYTHEDFSSIMTTNVESPYHLSQLAHPLLKASGAASIVFVSSIAGVVALPKLSVYSASKGRHTHTHIYIGH